MRSQRQGFLIIELFFALALLAIFALVASQVFTGVFTVFRENDAEQARVSGYEAALAKMRGDVWGANKIEVTDPSSAALGYPGGEKIVWKITAEGNLVRTVGDQRSAEWECGAPSLIFGSGRGALLLTEKGEEKGLATRLVSQIIVAGGGE